ncbi:MAG: peptide deformylase [Gemmatimonadota bacterium]
MALRKIELLGSDVLRIPADEVHGFDRELEELVREMFETMYHAEGAGLAAPQIGISQRIVVVDVPLDQQDPLDPQVRSWQPEATDSSRIRLALVNPRIVEQSSQEERSPEGCLSIPGVDEVVSRPARVVLEALDPRGQPLRVETDGLLARAFQHEVDHLDGVLFIDHLSPLKRRMLLKRYRKFLESEEGPGGS